MYIASKPETESVKSLVLYGFVKARFLSLLNQSLASRRHVFRYFFFFFPKEMYMFGFPSPLNPSLVSRRLVFGDY